MELDPSLNAEAMAPSALLLTLRRKRREQKRQGRSQAIRSTLRASTLKTEETILEKEKEEQSQIRRMGRKAIHDGGEARGLRPMTQDELIGAALEEEERNRASLKDWVRREEERRELRRVGRKRVRGPRWTFISRTVGSLVEEIKPALVEPVNAEPKETDTVHKSPSAAKNTETVGASVDQQRTTSQTPAAMDVAEGSAAVTVSIKEEEDQPTVIAPPVITALSKPKDSSSFEIDEETNPTPPNPAFMSHSPTTGSVRAGGTIPVAEKEAVPEEPAAPAQPQQYARNYLILSQIAGGLPEELKLILGDHIEWDHMKYIPHKGRPISELPVRLSHQTLADALC